MACGSSLTVTAGHMLWKVIYSFSSAILHAFYELTSEKLVLLRMISDTVSFKQILANICESKRQSLRAKGNKNAEFD